MSDAPGSKVIERDSSPTIRNPGAAISGMVLRTKRGADDVVALISDLNQFIRRFGGPDANHPYGYESAKGYFDEGGQGLYVVRALGYTAVAALKAINAINPALTGAALTVSASSKGSWGNGVLLTIQKYRTTITSGGVIATNTVVLESVVGVDIGDVIYFLDTAAAVHVSVVVNVVPATKTVTVLDNFAATLVTAGSIVYSTSTHKTKTTLAVAIPASTTITQIQVASSVNVDKGALLLLVNTAGDRVAELKVTEKNGAILNVTVLAAGGTVAIPAGSTVVSVNFSIVHVVDGETLSLPNLNLESDDPIGSVVAALNQSEFLRATIGAPTGSVTYRAYKYPTAIVSTFMATGTDVAPADGDYLGSNTNKNYTHGMLLFDNLDILPQFGIPGSNAVVQAGADTYAQGRANTVHVFEAPLLADTFDELAAFRQVTLNLQSSYSAMYAPWLIEADPLTPGAQVEIPPTGRALGTYSEVSTRRGTQKPPANEALSNVLGLTANFKELEFAMLNEMGVNLIRRRSGRGTRIMGSRTQWPNSDRKQFVNVRRILNAVKIGLKQFGEQLVQEANDDLLWATIDAAGKRYLEDRWRDGWFFPRKTPVGAFSFDCNAQTNSESTRLAAVTRSVAGVNPVLPGEIILFELAMLEGGAVTVTEL